MRFFEHVINVLYSDDYNFQEKLFALLTTMAELVVLLVFVADIVLGEDPTEVAVLGFAVFVSPLISVIALKRHKTKAAAALVCCMVVFVMLPVTFFFGGGLNGGSVIWFSFAYLYIGLLMSGKGRTLLLGCLTILAFAEYYLAYVNPGMIVPHGRMMTFWDSLVSVVLVGFVICAAVIFINKLFTRENEKARDQAEKVEEMSKAQSQFFSNMSHEIRTPINTILGLNEMILREKVSDEVASDAANIQAAGKLLLHLINDILDMSKVQSGQMELTLTEYNSGDMLSEIVAMLWIRAKDKGLDFHVNVSPDLPATLYGDDVRIKQILINVINNAIKYTKEGSVTLSVQCSKRSGDDITVLYSVTDTGVGIKKESIPYLFTAFRRVDEERNRYIEGTGLGLSIVKELTDLMNGNITVNSVYTKGSTFIIEIPQKVVSDEYVGDIDVARHHTLNSRKEYRKKFEAPDARILAVDDNESNLLVVTKLLRDTKVKIDTAMSGAEALKLTQDNKYDVILMDHLMPEMDGIECQHLIRTQTGGMSRDSKIAALTANAGEEVRKMFAKEGFDGYIEKPVSGDTLEVELCRLLPKELLHLIHGEDEIAEESILWMQSTRERKRPVAITTESVADLPDEIINKYGIGVIPHMVVTDEGTFRDGLEIETNGLLAYMADPDNKVATKIYGVNEHEVFFADRLTDANNLVHIALSGDVENSGYQVACEAAKAFGNVVVVDSRHLSSGQGLMVLEAAKLAADGVQPKQIAEEMKLLSKNIHTSFIVNDLDFLARAGQVSERVANLTRALMIRPVLVMKNGKLNIGSAYFGSRERAWTRYIDSVLKKEAEMDKSVLFVTYVGLTSKDMEFIRKYIEERVKFDRIYFQKASPAIAVNSGAGTFGLLYKNK
ncbi:MAG: DegV family EDD domain-containing protein [Lachnospiraceae bacterium]|nr:DegV family EDD domain-containing protein [Lachnospiraceae bacterium]